VRRCNALLRPHIGRRSTGIAAATTASKNWARLSATSRFWVPRANNLRLASVKWSQLTKRFRTSSAQIANEDDEHEKRTSQNSR